MSKRKVLALLLSGGFLVALGLNCLPNIGGSFVIPELLGGG
jgi:hypothetical protein